MLRAEGIEMLPFPVSLPSHPPFFPSVATNAFLFPTTSTATSPSPSTPRLFLSTHGYNRSSLSSSSSSSSSHNTDSPFLAADGDATDDDSSGTGNPLFDSDSESSSADGFQIHIQKLSHNSRRIRATIPIDAGLPTIWSILTDYERLPDFIPGLALSQLIEKRENFARLFQIGQQNLAFGLKFNAKGIVDCYEKGLENLPFGQRRDIEFKMIEGDFQTFEGRWSIEEYNNGRCEGSDSLLGQEFHTTLLYVVDVEPKLWLPVLLVEGRLCREIKMNLSCIREEAQKAIQNSRPSH